MLAFYMALFQVLIALFLIQLLEIGMRKQWRMIHVLGSQHSHGGPETNSHQLCTSPALAALSIWSINKGMKVLSLSLSVSLVQVKINQCWEIKVFRNYCFKIISKVKSFLSILIQYWSQYINCVFDNDIGYISSTHKL